MGRWKAVDGGLLAGLVPVTGVASPLVSVVVPVLAALRQQVLLNELLR